MPGSIRQPVEPMRLSSTFLLAAVWLGLAARLPAQSMGAQSRGEIRISVSVMPRFNADRRLPARAGGEPAVQQGAVRSNAPGLRVALVTGPVATAEPDAPRLLLVVPD